MTELAKTDALSREALLHEELALAFRERDEARAALARANVALEECNDCICDIADTLDVDSDADLAGIVSELVELLPEYELLDGTGDFANVQERAEYAADELKRLRLRVAKLETQLAERSRD
jgi:hypothetical protein